MTNSSTPQQAESSDKRNRHAAVFKKSVLLPLVVALLIVITCLGLLAHHLNTFTIPSASMEPTLQVGDRVEIDPDAYHAREPQRGDIVVFDGAGSFYPYESETSIKRFRDVALDLVGMAPKNNAIVKRVIGTPGDTLKCCGTDGKLLLNGEPL